MNNQIEKLTKRILLLENEIESLKILYKYKSEEVDELVGSNSWKITKPIRYIFSRVKFVKEILKKISAKINVKDQLIDQIPKIDIEIKTNFKYQKKNKIGNLIKPIAFYLPQFHPLEENNRFWGKGFTEWSNVRRVTKFFDSHYQPRKPNKLGYYDLRLPEVIREQIKIASNYGIHGFCFHFYWFNNKSLMTLPVDNFLKINSKFKFCFNWANENWTKNWDGLDKEVLLHQNYSEDSLKKMIKFMVPYLKNERYIQIQERPIFLIYNIKKIPKFNDNIKTANKILEENGLKPLFVIACETFGLKYKDLENKKVDALVEFPPHFVKSMEINASKNFYNNFNGKLFDYNQVVSNEITKNNESIKKIRRYKTAMLAWDNTARRLDKSHIFANYNITAYSQWIDHILSYEFNQVDNNKYLFINAWNEWAEGTYLEPDENLGFKNLDATYQIISNYNGTATQKPEDTQIKKRNNYAVIFHIYYEDLVEQYLKKISNFEKIGFDLYVTTNDIKKLSKIKSAYPNLNYFIFENRGRDMLPFIKILKKIEKLEYKAICKIHTKKSVYRPDGDKLRNKILNSLLNKNTINKILILLEDPSIGMIGPEGSILKFDEKNMLFNKDKYEFLLNMLHIKSADYFFSGSMFWFKQDALKKIELIDENLFERENGYADGMIHHSVERLLISLVKHNKYKIKSI